MAFEDRAGDDILAMRPTEIGDASRQLDELANRVERLMQAETPNVSVAPGARDEVSTRVADSLGHVHTAFDASMSKGVTEMREMAATLRARTGDVTALDEGFAL